MPPIGVGAGLLISSLIGGGSAIASSALSGRGSNNIAKQQQAFAQQQMDRSKPAYDQAYNYYTNLMNGSPGALQQAVGPDINNAQLQFQQAQKNLLQGTYARGGALGTGMANLEGQKAMTISQLLGGARQGAPAALAALASGSSAQALQGLAGAQTSNTQNSMLSNQAMGGIGSFITRLLSNPSLYSGGGNTLTGTGAGNIGSYSTPDYRTMLPSAVVGGLTSPSDYYPGSTVGGYPMQVGGR